MLVDSAMADLGEIAPRLLAWYDRNHRTLPWRSPPGSLDPDPYLVWLSEVMLQQTTVAAVQDYFATFTTRWPTVEALAAAPEEDVMSAWAGLGYYARARNLIACAREIAAEYGGRFPESEDELRSLPGIGDYTAAAIAAIAFDVPAVVVDANVERVVARLFAVTTPLPRGRPEIRIAAGSITPAERAGDFAQAMMDLGAMVCTPRSPSCMLCPLRSDCKAFAIGNMDSLPVKAPKAMKPVRRATIFWLESQGHVLLRRRPPKGLLGGMRALPSGPWTEADPGLAEAPADLDWRDVGGGRHVFTHLVLDYEVVAADLPDRTLEGEWWPVDRIADAGLPTLFARAAERALAGTEELA